MVPTYFLLFLILALALGDKFADLSSRPERIVKDEAPVSETTLTESQNKVLDNEGETYQFQAEVTRLMDIVINR